MKDKSVISSQSHTADSVSTSRTEFVQNSFFEDIRTDSFTITETLETHQVFDSLGITVFKPVRTERILSRSNSAQITRKDSTRSASLDSTATAINSTASDSYQLHKESEAQEMIGDIVGGVVKSFIPSWIKYFLGFLILITGIVYWIWLKRRLKKDTDAIPPA